jgi:hypothetical protein
MILNIGHEPSAAIRDSILRAPQKIEHGDPGKLSLVPSFE